MVRVVSPVVVVAIEFVAGPPLLRLQPPKVYPARVVEIDLASDSVETISESAETRVDDSEAGTDVARVFPSKTIVGLAAVVALAEVGTAIKDVAARMQVITKAKFLGAAYFGLELVADVIDYPLQTVSIHFKHQL
jgi:hypothetical protein